MQKKNDTLRYTAEQIKAKIARGEDQTDWRKADAVTGKKLEASIRADAEDIYEEPHWANAVMGVPAPRDASRSELITTCSSASTPAAEANGDEPVEQDA